MITTTTPDRIEGRDAHGERWAAHTIPGDQEDEPTRVVLRTIDGNAHLEQHDAVLLARWIDQLTGEW